MITTPFETIRIAREPHHHSPQDMLAPPFQENFSIKRRFSRVIDEKSGKDHCDPWDTLTLTVGFVQAVINRYGVMQPDAWNYGLHPVESNHLPGIIHRFDPRR